MKNQIKLMMLLVGISFQVLANKPQFSKVDKVVVYLSGAHLYYKEQLQLQAGTNVFTFENISANLVENTLQASSKGGTLMEVNTQIRYKEKKITTTNYAKSIAQVLDSLEEINYQIQSYDNILYTYSYEKKMLLNHPLIKGTSNRDSLPLLKSSMEFTREKLNEISALELKSNRQKNKLEKEKTRLTQRHQELVLLQNGEDPYNQVIAQAIKQVMVSVYAENAGIADISFNYFVPNASWVPSYDLVANPTNNQLTLKYFAQITQQSGLNWNHAALTLSSSNPMELNVKPVLAHWYIGFQEYRKLMNMRMSNAAAPLKKQNLRLAEKDNASMDDVRENYAEQKSLSDYIQISENLIRTEYAIKLKYEINSDGKSHKVMIKEQQIPVLLEFAAVPKLSTEAYLMGRLSGWEDLQILPGSARIYFDGAYVGETFVGDQSSTDTLDLNLGRDRSLVINRKKVKDKTRVKTLESEKIETRTIEIIVRNTKSQTITINVEDQIPISQNPNEIKVSLIHSDGAILDEVSGKLSWKLKLSPKETEKISFTYEIRYPKNKTVFGL
ncbi:MAG: DUF4139 domain-containing protein [Bacteroidia bacterium]|nr:DUF4139 domain-containing protein [Bacteroidia bacterium]